MKYLGYTYWQTNTTTDLYVALFGRPYATRVIRRVWRIEDTRGNLLHRYGTSAAGCRRIIRDDLDAEAQS